MRLIRLDYKQKRQPDSLKVFTAGQAHFDFVPFGNAVTTTLRYGHVPAYVHTVLTGLSAAIATACLLTSAWTAGPWRCWRVSRSRLVLQTGTIFRLDGSAKSCSSELTSLERRMTLGIALPVQMSRFWTSSAFFSMNSRRGSTASPMSNAKMSSDSTASSTRT